MGIKNWFQNQARVYRAGQIAKDKSALNGDGLDTQRRKMRIAKNEELQKIASENNTKTSSKVTNKTFNASSTINNGVNTTVNMSKKK